MNVNKYMRRSVRFYDRRRSTPFGSEWDLCTEKKNIQPCEVINIHRFQCCAMLEAHLNLR